MGEMVGGWGGRVGRATIRPRIQAWESRAAVETATSSSESLAATVRISALNGRECEKCKQ